MKRLMLLDVYGLVYRAFFALPPLITSRGVPINAAYGFTLMLNKILADEQPTHLIACFDKGLPADRLARYPDYKAQRTSMPDDLRPQFELVRRILQALRIPIVEVAGQEADDVIATLAHQAGQPTLVVTGDLDLLQMVTEQVTALVTRRGITELARYDVEAVRQRFGLEPAQLADYRGLKGDPSDNLPGVPGVGEKTATKMIQAAGSLDALLADPALAGSAKMQQAIVQHGEQARACRDVSVLKRDLPVQLNWPECIRREADPDQLYKLYYELEFKTLLQRLPQPDSLAELKAAEALPGEWITLADAHLPAGLTGPVAAVTLGDRLGLACHGQRGWDLPLAPTLWQKLETVIAHDAKLLMRKLGPRSVQDDVMIAAHLLDSGRSFLQVDEAAAQFLDRTLPPSAGAAAAATWLLAPRLRQLLAERGQLSLYQDVELPLTGLLAEMEIAGVAIDPSQLESIGLEVDQSMDRLQGEIYALAGQEFNLGSPQQLGAILFEKLKIEGGKRNKTGWGTGVEVLQGLAAQHPICGLVLEYREVAKLKNTYIDAIPKLIDEDGRLRTCFNQTVTATGRLSSTHPNLQNIPVRGELGRRLRRAFVAPPGWTLLAADYDQIELRLMAHLCGDEAMLQAFQQGQDIHDFTARQIFSLDTQTVTAQQRRVAKSVNFGLLYGMSDFGLAARLGISRAEAKAMTGAYFARFPSVRSFIHGVIEQGRQDGYVSTLLGRRRAMPALRSSNFMQRAAAEREATNAPIQGSAADLMKLAMVRIRGRLGCGSARMLLQIHDELIFEVPNSELNDLAALVKHEMENALPLQVPITVTLKSGPNWYEVEPLNLPLARHLD